MNCIFIQYLKTMQDEYAKTWLNLVNFVAIDY